MKKKIYTIALLLWMAVIWYLSSQTGPESTTVSTTVLTYSVGPVRVNHWFNGATIRDAAHISEYVVLAILAYLTINQYTKNNVLIKTVLFCFIWSVSDEIHQHFTPGREMEFIDIMLDSTGIIIGAALMHIARKKYDRKYRKHSN